MKITTTILHLLWGAYFSFTFLGNMSISYYADAEGMGSHRFTCFSGDFTWFAVLALVWLLFGGGLFWGRSWIWFGCVIFTMSSLAFESFAALITLGIPVHHDVFSDIFGFCSALLVTSFLWLTRREFITGRRNQLPVPS